MNDALKRMLSKYTDRSRAGLEQALREIIQEITLVGLWRGKFFEHAAFYGGTALRILYGLDRFSEDMDFTLFETDHKFSWDRYAEPVKRELQAYGFDVTMQEKTKAAQCAVKSAFLKGNTLQELLKIGASTENVHGLHPETQVRIKIEVDSDPIISFPTENLLLNEPAPVSIRTVTREGLFAGKMHATLFREWRGRVKGRDWYDMVWYIRRGVPLDLTLFSQIAQKENPLSPAEFLTIATAKIEQLDISSAKRDITAFVADPALIEREWSKDYFKSWLKRLTFQSHL